MEKSHQTATRFAARTINIADVAVKAQTEARHKAIRRSDTIKQIQHDSREAATRVKKSIANHTRSTHKRKNEQLAREESQKKYKVMACIDTGFSFMTPFAEAKKIREDQENSQ